MGQDKKRTRGGALSSGPQGNGTIRGFEVFPTGFDGTYSQRLRDAEPSTFRDQDWRAMGLCAQSDPDLWFAVGAMEHKAAKSICRRCPVREQCLSYAMEAPVDHGIWGGLTERERRRARRLSHTEAVSSRYSA